VGRGEKQLERSNNGKRGGGGFFFLTGIRKKEEGGWLFHEKKGRLPCEGEKTGDMIAKHMIKKEGGEKGRSPKTGRRLEEKKWLKAQWEGKKSKLGGLGGGGGGGGQGDVERGGCETKGERTSTGWEGEKRERRKDTAWGGEEKKTHLHPLNVKEGQMGES